MYKLARKIFHVQKKRAKSLSLKGTNGIGGPATLSLRFYLRFLSNRAEQAVCGNDRKAEKECDGEKERERKDTRVYRVTQAYGRQQFSRNIMQ